MNAMDDFALASTSIPVKKVRHKSGGQLDELDVLQHPPVTNFPDIDTIRNELLLRHGYLFSEIQHYRLLLQPRTRDEFDNEASSLCLNSNNCSFCTDYIPLCHILVWT